MTRLICKATLLFSLLTFCCLTLSQQCKAQEEAAGAGAAAASETETAEQPTEPVAAPPEPAGDAEEDWMSTIDAWFGENLVGPLATAFFYDFGTGPTPVVDDNGDPVLDPETGEQQIIPGWLKTEAQPDGTSVPFVVVWLLVGGLFLTLRMGFINLRAFWHAIRLTKGDYDDPDDEGEVSHFQALSAALSATVGLGNIGGVAIAIGLGGPGAAFWIFVIGFIGMTTKFAECTLGQLYRVKDDAGSTLGGPMRYLREGLSQKGLGGLGIILSTVFALLCIGASFGGGNAYQVRQSLSAIKTDITFLEANPWIYGLALSVAVAAVIIGGIKSIGAVAARIVPLMCFAYITAALWILLQNVAVIPEAVATIVSSAFSPAAAYGGFVGVLVLGVKRAVFSNEAGVGSAAIAHSAAKTNEPVSEGIVALLEPFIDTMVVCTITALVLVVSGAYDAEQFASQHAPETVIAAIEGNVDSSGSDAEVTQAKEKLAGLISGQEGAALTLVAFRSSGFHWFGYILFAAVVLFAFSTCISWSYYGERCWVQLFGVQSSIVYKLIFIVFTFLGSIINAKNVLDFSDLMILGMSLPNLLGVFILSGVVKRSLDDYWGRYRNGELERNDS